jgi:hypothetical protein
MRLAAASWFGPALATIILTSLSIGAYGQAKRHVEKLRWMVAAPRASLAAPVSGPAIYAGVLRGPKGRKTPMGSNATMYWWWVEERKGKSVKTVCTANTRDELVLAEGDAAIPLTLLGTETDVSLTGDSLSDNYDGRLVLDLGSGASSAQASTPPATLADCGGPNRTYSERFVEPGARVEVLACFDRGALRACPGAPHAGVLAIPTIARDRERRVEASLVGFRIVGLAAMVSILFVFIATMVGQGAVLRGMKPAPRQP